MKTTKNILGLLLLCIASFSLGWSFNPQPVQAPLVVEDSNHEISFDVFWETWDLVEKKYVDANALADKEKSVYGATKGLVRSLEDPFSGFMTPDENKEFFKDLEGSLEGIGAELTMKHEMPMVVSPLKDSPAVKAGLMPQDIIIKVDGEEIADLSLTEVVKKIRGPKGTMVELTVLRAKTPEPVVIQIVREKIHVASVEGEMKEEIALIEINRFGADTVQEFYRILADLKKQNPKGMILDLRFNGGGFLDASVDIASAFLPSRTPVVIVRERDQAKTQILKTHSISPQVPETPLVVLINGGSASASEILSGALQDHGRATVVGEKSFGKGTVQEVVMLSDRSSLRITVAKWFTPNDRNVTEDKIVPDEVVKRTEEDYENDKDPQLERAIEILQK